MPKKASNPEHFEDSFNSPTIDISSHTVRKSLNLWTAQLCSSNICNMKVQEQMVGKKTILCVLLDILCSQENVLCSR